MNANSIDVLLADDDPDDRFLFKEALDELSIPLNYSSVKDGEELMSLLVNADRLPSVLFLDLNMPRKNGFECLADIKKDNRLKNIPVVVISTSGESDIVNTLYKGGANYYICKPNSFEKLKDMLRKLLASSVPVNLAQPNPENFVLS